MLDLKMKELARCCGNPDRVTLVDPYNESKMVKCLNCGRCGPSTAAGSFFNGRTLSRAAGDLWNRDVMRSRS